jgi:hypothetical protein
MFALERANASFDKYSQQRHKSNLEVPFSRENLAHVA